MFTQKITLAAFVALSATVLASNAHAMDCADMTSNQLLAAIERGQCVVETAGNSNTDENTWIRTSRNGGDAKGGKASGGYGY
jgi:hypothetical protein